MNLNQLGYYRIKCSYKSVLLAWSVFLDEEGELCLDELFSLVHDWQSLSYVVPKSFNSFRNVFSQASLLHHRG